MSRSIQRFRFSGGGLIIGQVTVDDEQVGSGGDGVGDEPFEAVGGIAKVSVFVQVEIAGVANLERHEKLLFGGGIVT